MKELTVKDLKEAFGTDYPVINDLIMDKEDDFIISTGDLILRSDFLATKLWSKADIKGVLRERGYKGTQDEVNDVCRNSYINALFDCTDADWEIIHMACEDSGYKTKKKIFSK